MTRGLDPKRSRQLKKLLPSTARGLFLGALVAVPVVATHISTAGFSPQEVRAHVEIDGVDYGTFDNIDGLQDGLAAPDTTTAKLPEHGGQAFKKIVLNRDFVTDPSLYLWAKNV